MSRAAVFLDRDGTINKEVSFLGDPAQLELEEGAVEGLAVLQAAGFVLLVASNQSGVARGYFDEKAVKRVNTALSRMLARDGIRIESFHYCPHLVEGIVPGYARVCDCRKPKPGLIFKAAEEGDIDLSRSYAVGDSARDLEAGRAAGLRTVLVMTGFAKGAVEEVKEKGLADHIAGDLADAARWIVKDAGEMGDTIVNG